MTQDNLDLNPGSPSENLGKLYSLFMLQIPYLYNENNNNRSPKILLWWF